MACIIITRQLHRKDNRMNIAVNGTSLPLNASGLTPTAGGLILTGQRLSVVLEKPPRLFYRHGWQSWSLTTWLDPAEPVVPISAPLVRIKDEDAPYALSQHPVSAWVGAAEMENGQVLLLGALDLSGRVEISGTRMEGFYEDEHTGRWLLVLGSEMETFKLFSTRLGESLGASAGQPPRVWCSWYGLYNTINEPVINRVVDSLGDLPFDVIQIDDGWQVGLGDWQANKRFPSGMAAMAGKVQRTGRRAGLWLAPFIVPRRSSFALEHPDWMLKDEQGKLVYAGPGWSGNLNALDCSHPGVLEWLDGTIRRVRGWGYSYLKLDFLYAAAAPGVRKTGAPRESAFRQAMQVIREAAGKDCYLLACGSPIIPVLGLCDGIRVGPDVSPLWQSTPLSTWVNNPNQPGTHNAMRTSLHRLWLKQLIHVDPDVAYFRSRHNSLTEAQARLLQDLVRVTGFKATSDLPDWLGVDEVASLRAFFKEQALVEQVGRYSFKIDGRLVDFSALIPLPRQVHFPANLALLLGLLQMGWLELLPGLVYSLKARFSSRQ
jgi:alpha-galactosidase